MKQAGAGASASLNNPLSNMNYNNLPLGGIIKQTGTANLNMNISAQDVQAAMEDEFSDSLMEGAKN